MALVVARSALLTLIRRGGMVHAVASCEIVSTDGHLRQGCLPQALAAASSEFVALPTLSISGLLFDASGVIVCI